ncbi:hypothetical protein F5Y15DRAFT_411968 [Xylariaceae sp. FL0016]|nr:hypothetical protein F5Y15DRAFT_411968 [Xylariaceae sp. FL0016]
MPASLVIAYPKGCNVNLDYYLNKHIPAAMEGFKQGGMTSYRIAKGVPGTNAAFEVMVTAEFPSKEAIIALMTGPGSAEAMKKLAEDLPNYSEKAAEISIMEEA